MAKQAESTEKEVKVQKKRGRPRKEATKLVDAKTGEVTFVTKVPSLKGSRGRPPKASKGATSRLKAARSKVEKQLDHFVKLQQRIQRACTEFVLAQQDFEKSVGIYAEKALAEKQAEKQAEKEKQEKQEKQVSFKKKKAKKKVEKQDPNAPKKKRGRPKGSKNKPKGLSTESTESPTEVPEVPEVPEVVEATTKPRRGRPPKALKNKDSKNTGRTKGDDVEDDDKVIVTTFRMGPDGKKQILKSKEETHSPSNEFYEGSNQLYKEYDNGEEPQSIKMIGYCPECGGLLMENDKLSKFIVACPYCDERTRTKYLVETSDKARNPRKDRYATSEPDSMKEMKEVEEVEEVETEFAETESSETESAELALPGVGNALIDSDIIDDEDKLGFVSVEMESISADTVPFSSDNPDSESFVEGGVDEVEDVEEPEGD